MKPTFARMAIAGILPILALATAATAARNMLPVTHALRPFILFFNNALVSFALFDVLLIIFPFQVFNGRHIWDWNKWAWLPLAAWTLVLLFV